MSKPVVATIHRRQRLQAAPQGEHVWSEEKLQ